MSFKGTVLLYFLLAAPSVFLHTSCEQTSTFPLTAPWTSQMWPEMRQNIHILLKNQLNIANVSKNPVTKRPHFAEQAA